MLSQLPTLAGYGAEGSNCVIQPLDLLANFDEIEPASLALAVLLPRTRLGKAGRLVAIVVPLLLLVVLELENVQTVRGGGEIRADQMVVRAVVVYAFTRAIVRMRILEVSVADGVQTLRIRLE